MRIFLDENVPRQLKRQLPDLDVTHISETSLLQLKNGQLLLAIEPDFDVFVTYDRSLRFQNSLKSKNLAFIVLRAYRNRIEELVPLIPEIRAALGTLRPGAIVILENRAQFPARRKSE